MHFDLVCSVDLFVLPFPWLHIAFSLMQHRVCPQPFVTGHSNCMFGSEPLADFVAIIVTRLVLRSLFSHMPLQSLFGLTDGQLA